MEIINPYEKKNINYKEVTALTQYLRFKLLLELIADGLPKDTSERDFFLKLTNACDSTALSVKKTENDSKITDAQTDYYKLVTNILKTIPNNPFVIDSELNLPEFNRVEGETVIGIDDCLD